MLKKQKCFYCKKKRMFCLFMKVKGFRFHMCNICQRMARAGKKNKDGRWTGERKTLQKIKKPKNLYSWLPKESKKKIEIFLGEDYLD